MRLLFRVVFLFDAGYHVRLKRSCFFSTGKTIFHPAYLAYLERLFFFLGSFFDGFVCSLPLQLPFLQFILLLNDVYSIFVPLSNFQLSFYSYHFKLQVQNILLDYPSLVMKFNELFMKFVDAEDLHLNRPKIFSFLLNIYFPLLQQICQMLFLILMMRLFELELPGRGALVELQLADLQQIFQDLSWSYRGVFMVTKLLFLHIQLLVFE